MQKNRIHVLVETRLRELRDSFPMQSGLIYHGPADFVLQHGKWYQPSKLPSHIPFGAPNTCFANAINASVLYGLPYVEGFAVGYYPGHDPALIHHGWNLLDGRVIDTTWCAEAVMVDGNWRVKVPFENALLPLAYYGVIFRVERADEATWDGGATVLDDPHRGHPILRKFWQGERDDVKWEFSERLRIVRDKDEKAYEKWAKENEKFRNDPIYNAISVDLMTGRVLHSVA